MLYICVCVRACACVRVCFFKANHQPDATIFQFIILTFVYSSTCFRRSPDHHQELNVCTWQPLVLSSYRGDSRAVFVVGPVVTGPTTNTARLSTIRR
jgi:hypothetical protein